MSGLLINGVVVPVPGRTIIGPHEEKWAHLSAGDGIPRSRVPSQFVIHKTLADDPETILPGAGPSGGVERTAEFWDEDPKHSGAHGVTGEDGIAACLEDLVRFEAWHGNQSNDRSVGWEMRERPGGGCYQATYDTTVDVVLTACEAIGIQFQCPSYYTSNTPLPRYADGGRSLVGIFGHRDITDSRNRFDPGDKIFEMLKERGVEQFDFYRGADIPVWQERQRWINKRGPFNLIVDGIPGPATTAALKAIGYRSGIWALGRA